MDGYIYIHCKLYLTFFFKPFFVGGGGGGGGKERFLLQLNSYSYIAIYVLFSAVK